MDTTSPYHQIALARRLIVPWLILGGALFAAFLLPQDWSLLRGICFMIGAGAFGIGLTKLGASITGTTIQSEGEGTASVGEVMVRHIYGKAMLGVVALAGAIALFAAVQLSGAREQKRISHATRQVTVDIPTIIYDYPYQSGVCSAKNMQKYLGAWVSPWGVRWSVMLDVNPDTDAAVRGDAPLWLSATLYYPLLGVDDPELVAKQLTQSLHKLNAVATYSNGGLTVKYPCR